MCHVRQRCSTNTTSVTVSHLQIPVSGISIGPVHKKDVIKASVMLERKPEYAVILAFDVKVDADARDMAESMGVQIFTADIIYHLFDKASKYIADIKARGRQDAAAVAVFPVVLDIIPEYVFNIKQPIVLGCKVVDGMLKLGTPLCVPARDFVAIGTSHIHASSAYMMFFNCMAPVGCARLDNVAPPKKQYVENAITDSTHQAVNKTTSSQLTYSCLVITYRLCAVHPEEPRRADRCEEG